MVINESLVGVVAEAMKHAEIEGIYGARHGILGVLNEDFIDLRQEPDLELVAKTPASALGSCRHKPDEKDCEKVFEVFQKYNVKYWFYIGGNDTAETADIVNKIARERNYELRVFHIPKTIDNDLKITDHCPGYPSAARYVAMSFMGNDFDQMALPGVKIDVVMGRQAGWLTAAAALARRGPGTGPHLIYVPEQGVSLDKFVADVEEVYAKYGRCLVAASEGMVDAEGKLMVEAHVREYDAHGNPLVTGAALGDILMVELEKRSKIKDIRARTDTLGYAQRSFPGVASLVDQAEARLVGEEAVHYAMKGDIDGSVALHRVGEGADYRVETILVKLAEVAKETKNLPDEFIAPGGNDVTKAFLDYIRPLVGKLPRVASLTGVKVPKAEVED